MGARTRRPWPISTAHWRAFPGRRGRTPRRLPHGSTRCPPSPRVGLDPRGDALLDELGVDVAPTTAVALRAEMAPPLAQGLEWLAGCRRRVPASPSSSGRCSRRSTTCAWGAECAQQDRVGGGLLLATVLDGRPAPGGGSCLAQGLGARPAAGQYSDREPFRFASAPARSKRTIAAGQRTTAQARARARRSPSPHRKQRVPRAVERVLDGHQVRERLQPAGAPRLGRASPRIDMR